MQRRHGYCGRRNGLGPLDHCATGWPGNASKRGGCVETADAPRGHRPLPTASEAVARVTRAAGGIAHQGM